MKVVKEIFLTEEERDILKKASEILDFISDSVGKMKMIISLFIKVLKN